MKSLIFFESIILEIYGAINNHTIYEIINFDFTSMSIVYSYEIMEAI